MADERARALRKAMTAHEVKLWSHLRGLRKSHGWHFRRQAPFGSWVLDFVCFKAGLVIELDGSQHGEPAQAASDRKRDAFLQREGFVVLRFWNRDVDEELDGVWLAIMDALRAVEARMLSKDRNPHPFP